MEVGGGGVLICSMDDVPMVRFCSDIIIIRNTCRGE